MARVYVSSTYEDLVEERRAAIDAIRRLEHHAVGMEDYGASEQRPRDKCVEDVQRCDAYVGIIAWRYGYVPDDAAAEGKSITRLEYEAAGAAGIPRLLFLSPDRGVWDGAEDPDAARRQAIAAFRDEVGSAHVIARFTTPTDVKTEVMAALSNELGRGRRFPELLPYFCDRTEQVRELHRTISPDDPPAESRPIVCVLHGDEAQAHSRFIDCLRRRYVARIIGQSEEQVSVQEYRLKWPKARDEEAFRRELVDSLGEEVCKRLGAPLDLVAMTLSGVRGPVLVSAYLPTAEWKPADRARLETFVRFWLEWTEPIHCWPMIVLLYAEYHEVGSGVLDTLVRGRKARRRNREVAEAFDALAETHRATGRLLVLPRLSSVAFSDVEHWARSDDVRQITGDAYVVEDVRDLYADDEAIPMVPLADHLKGVLHRYFDQRKG